MKEDLTTGIEKDLYHLVTKLPLSSLLKNKPPKGQTHIIVDSNSGNILSFCSEDYQLRLNKTLFTRFENKLKQENIPYRKDIKIFDGTKFYVDYVILRRVHSSTIKDLLPVLSIWNSYDGKVKTQIVFGYHRLINGSHLGRPIECNLTTSAKHNALDDDELFDATIEEFISKSKQFLKHTKQDLEVFERLKLKPETISGFKRHLNVFPMTQKARQMALEILDKDITIGLYLNELGEQVHFPGAPVSYFTIYSAMNYSLYHNNYKELPEIKQKKDKLMVCYFIKKL